MASVYLCNICNRIVDIWARKEMFRCNQFQQREITDWWARHEFHHKSQNVKGVITEIRI